MNKIDLILLQQYLESKIDASYLRIGSAVKEEFKNIYIGQKQAYEEVSVLITSLLENGGN